MTWPSMRPSAVIDRVTSVARRVTRYDLVLTVIPVALALGALLGTSPAVPAPTAVAAASVIGGLAVIDALFLNPPRGPAAGGPRP